MKKLVFFTTMILCLSGVSRDDEIIGLSDAKYAGSGTWTDNSGAEGSYEVHLEFLNNEMRVDYQWPEGVITEFFTFLFAHDSFDILDRDGLVVGHGTRDSWGSLTYEIDTATGHYAETITFLSGIPGIIKEGSKQTGDRVATWSEKLYNLEYTEHARENQIP